MPNSAYIHILLNHSPVIGSGFILILGLYSYLKKNDNLKRFTMMLFILLSLLTIVIFITGNNAKGIVKGSECVIEENIDTHEEFAEKSFIAMEALGGLSLLYLVFNRFSKPVPNLISIIFLIALIAVLVMMMYTAHLGGKIVHNDIVPKF